MTSHGLITDAENAIARGRQHAAVSRTDPEHEAAVELMACGLLVDRKVVESEHRDRLVSQIDAYIQAHEKEHPFAHAAFRAGMREVRLLVAGGALVDGSAGDLFDPTDPAGDS